MRLKAILISILGLSVLSAFSCTHSTGAEPITFESVMSKLDPLVDQFEQLLQSLTPAERKRFLKASRAEFDRQTEFLSTRLHLSAGDLSRALELGKEIRHVISVTKDFKKRKAAHDEYNRKMFDLIGPEKFQRYADFKIRRFQDFVSRVRTPPVSGSGHVQDQSKP